MGLRKLRVVKDPLLNKRSREVTVINDRLLALLDDMVETMYEEDGIGLAGPQVGILRRIFVADIGDGVVYKVLNPEFLEVSGEDTEIEGCLSVPNFRGTVSRAAKVKMKYTDIEGNEQIIEADGLLAKCFQHETDHLNGTLINMKHLKEIVTDEDYHDFAEEKKAKKLDNKK